MGLRIKAVSVKSAQRMNSLDIHRIGKAGSGLIVKEDHVVRAGSNSPAYPRETRERD